MFSLFLILIYCQMAIYLPHETKLIGFAKQKANVNTQN